MTSTMTPRHVPSIESIRRMPSFNTARPAATGPSLRSQFLTTANYHSNSNSNNATRGFSSSSTLSLELDSDANDGEFEGGMNVHRGAIDKTTVTTQPPARVMAHVARVLQAMGVEVQQESVFRYRCIRPKKGCAASAQTQMQTQLVAPTPVSPNSNSAAASRCVSPFDDSRPLSPFDSPTIPCTLPSIPNAEVEVLYGTPTDDSCDEVRFSVELTKLEGLSGTYSLDVRRLKGSIRSYGFVYNAIRERANINRL